MGSLRWYQSFRPQRYLASPLGAVPAEPAAGRCHGVGPGLGRLPGRLLWSEPALPSHECHQGRTHCSLASVLLPGSRVAHPMNLSRSLGPPLAEATALRPELRSGAGLEAERLEAAHTVDECNARWPQAQHMGISSSSLPQASVSKETIWQPPPPRSLLPPLQSPT